MDCIYFLGGAPGGGAGVEPGILSVLREMD